MVCKKSNLISHSELKANYVSSYFKLFFTLKGLKGSYGSLSICIWTSLFSSLLGFCPKALINLTF